MPESFPQRQQQLHFASLMAFLENHLQNSPHHRASNPRFPWHTILKAAFAIFPLKPPSLPRFKKQTLPEQNNFRSVYRVHGDILCDNQIRMAPNPLAPTLLRPLFAVVFHLWQKAGLLHHYRFRQQTGKPRMIVRATLPNDSARPFTSAAPNNQPVLLVEDALYANAPHLRQITGYGWNKSQNENCRFTIIIKAELMKKHILG